MLTLDRCHACGLSPCDCCRRDPDDEREMRLDGCSRLRPEGSTVDVRTGELW